jgi:DNA-binding transcriptional ArsR family regulator
MGCGSLTKENAMNTQQQQQTKLDEVWNRVNKEKALDFFKRAVSPTTTVSELMAILSYDKVQGIKEQLADVTLGDVVRGAPPAPQAAPSQPRAARTSTQSIEQEKAAILAVVKANPGINRGELARQARSQLANKSLAHVSYLLRKLSEEGHITQKGERRGATYEAR